ncbi:MAG: hypothetical protein FWH27_18355 [Planctomycetaceae bacterium]|nr:hypothetical protein [Planctomycetaceae bacterium]
MKTAYFEVLYEDYQDDGNPYSATLVTDDPVSPDEPNLQRIRRLRNGMIGLTLAIVCLTILSYIAIGLFYSSESLGLDKSMKMMTRLNGICVNAASILLIPLMIVVYRLSRALGNSRVMAIVYLIFSTAMFCAGDRTPTVWWFILPLGSVIIPFILYIHAQNVLLEPQNETETW